MSNKGDIIRDISCHISMTIRRSVCKPGGFCILTTE
nr:MAG TPA: Integrin alpha-V, Integrin beta-3 DOMAIN, PSI, EGF REPEATS [Bacteriophage sp.]